MNKKEQRDAVRITFFGAMLYLWTHDKQFRKAALAILKSIPKKEEKPSTPTDTKPESRKK